MPRQRSWTDDDLRRAVPQAASYNEVLRELGLKPGGGTYMAIRVRVAQLDIDDSHLHNGAGRDRTPTSRELRAGAPRSGGGFRPPGSRPWREPEVLAIAVAKSRSYAGVLRELKLKPGGGTYVKLKQEIGKLGLDTGHFTGQGWAKGLKNPVPRRKRPLEEILVRDSDYSSTHRLKKRLLKEGVKEARCEICGITDWNGKPAPLQLDHINGDRRDHRLENLRILCPNCHAQTDTWCGKNKGSYDLDDVTTAIAGPP